MNKYIWSVLLALCMAGAVRGQNASSTRDDRLEYNRVVTERAHKIVGGLRIPDPTKFNKVRAVIAKQYSDLREIHDQRDRQLKAVKEGPQKDKTKAEKQIKAIEATAQKQQDALHARYLSRLSELLTPEQVEGVKDGMTYGALPATYKNYLAMIPTLTEDQKTTIHGWLSEAREHAMDAGSSKEKLAWFGKYKGKITNYLTVAGYDLKKEEAAWIQRLKAGKAAGAGAAFPSAKEPSGNQEPAPAQRAAAIVGVLGIEQGEKASRVQALLTRHFDSLAVIFRERKAAMEEARTAGSGAPEERSRNAWDAANSRLNKLLPVFLGKLSVELTGAQVETVKDVMTEGGLQQEYDHYQELFPGLTDLQKAQVMYYLKEARENAMNAETAKERSQWFIKYRGRANNFLAAAGYDLRKATEELELKKAAKGK